MEYSVDHIFQITVEDIRQLCYPDPGPTDVIWRENRPELCLRRRLRVNRKLPSLFTSVGSPLMGGEEPRTISVGVRALRYKNAGLERIRNAPPSPRPPHQSPRPRRLPKSRSYLSSPPFMAARKRNLRLWRVPGVVVVVSSRRAATQRFATQRCCLLSSTSIAVKS